MKLTDREIIEALNSGKRIIIDGCELVAGGGWLRFHNNGCVVQLSLDLIKSDDFEIVEPEIDWEKVIKEKYLCKFWDGNKEPSTQECRIMFLEKYTQHYYAPFISQYGANYQHCRPLRADEVKLVTDEKELWK